MRIQRSLKNKKKLMSQINVTPMVDVMLVLLIVFMITAPLLTTGIKVDLPETENSSISDTKEPVTVTITKDGFIYVMDELVSLEQLPLKILAISDAGFEGRVYVKGDKNVEYGQIAKVMGKLNNSGFKSIGLVTVQE